MEELVLKWTVSLICFGTFVSTLEYLSLSKDLANETMMSWDILSLRKTRFELPGIRRVLNHLFEFPNIKRFLLFRAAIALATIEAVWWLGSEWHVHLLLITNLFLHGIFTQRFPIGAEGSDQVASLVFGALSLCMFLDDKALAVRLAAIFICGQLCLAYLTSGVAKAVSRSWRNGSALTGIMSTDSYGSVLVYGLIVDRKWLAVLLSLSIISYQLAAPFMFFSTPEIAPYFFAAGLLFHLSTAVFMGLGCFFWNFAAMYPSSVYCSYLVLQN